MGTETQFRTFQTVKAYEEALGRHSQWCRWVKVIICPCVDPTSGQPDIQCDLCKGRGEIYRNPGPFQIEQEVVKHNNLGRLYPQYGRILSGTIYAWCEGTALTISATQPDDGSYIQIDAPYPRNYKQIVVNYEFDPLYFITGEASEVIQSNTLRVTGTTFTDKGQTYYGSIDEVTRVYNVTKDETYTVSSAVKEFIYLASMGTWESADILEVDYSYLKPFEFMLHSISEKRRRDSAYVIDQADATLVTPYWANVTPHDLVTGLSSLLSGYAVIDPTVTDGNDIIGDAFDIAGIDHVLDRNGIEYSPGTDMIVVHRNEIKWLTTKPLVPYTIHYTYNPTFIGLMTYDTARSSENKRFVNRLNVMLRDRMTKETAF